MKLVYNIKFYLCFSNVKCVLPVTLYRCETWPVNVQMKERLRVTQKSMAKSRDAC